MSKLLRDRSRGGRFGCLLLPFLGLATQVLRAQVGLVPVSELTAPYLGVGEPGLYPGGANQPSGAHLAYGESRAAQVVPRAPDGSPSADGWIGLVGIGMSNANQEWSRFERESDRLARHAGPSCSSMRLKAAWMLPRWPTRRIPTGPSSTGESPRRG